MNTLRYKIWADLWLQPSRSFLAIISVAVGILCVGALFGMIELQLSTMDAAHQNSQPSQINLILRQDADQQLLTDIEQIPGVAGVDIMTPLSIRFKTTDHSDWQTGSLMIRPNFSGQKFDQTTLVSGHWPADGELAIENLSAETIDLKIGDQLELETDTGRHSLAISGVVRHPFVKPPKFGGQMQFFAAQATASRLGLPANTFRELLVQTLEPKNADQNRLIASEIRSLLNRHHIGVSVTLLQDPKNHWGRPFLAGLNLILEIMGLLSLVLASVLIANTLAAHISQQTEQIGVLKAIGASRVIIAKIYLGETLVIAVSAILLAIPASLAVAYFSSCQLLALFNIDCGPFRLPFHAISYMLLGGLLAPLLAALIPILQGANISVKTAIGGYGLRKDFGNQVFDLWVEQTAARFLPTLYAAALVNVFRRKLRFLLTQSVLIIAGMMFLVLMSLMASLNFTLDNEMNRNRYAVRIAFSKDQPADQVIALAKSVAKTQAVEVWRRLPVEIFADGRSLHQKGSMGLQLFSMPAASKMYQPRLEAGRWLQAGDVGQRVLVLSADTAALNHIQVGDMLGVQLGRNQASWQVIGLYRWLAGNQFLVEPVYAPLETVNGINPSGVDMASFALLEAPISTLAEEAAFLADLKESFIQQVISLDIFNTTAKLEQNRIARNQFKPIVNSLSGLAIMIVTVGGIGLSGSLAINVLQRRGEIAVLRAIGAASNSIFRLFLLEGLLHGIVSWMLCVPLAYFAALPLTAAMGEIMLGIKLDFTFNWLAVWYWLIIVLLLSWIAAYSPAAKACKLTVRENLSS